MIANGRQYAGDLSGIRDDHVARYLFAVRVLHRYASLSIGDAGAGCGYGSHLLASHGHVVRAVEIDPEAVAFAREHWAHPQVKFEQGDAATQDFADRQALVAFEVIEHLPDAESALRLWQPDILIGSVPNQDVTPFDPKRQTYHVRHYTPGELRALLAATGWTLKRMATQKAKRGAQAAVVDGEDGMTLVFVATR
jgi:SAM-dependent methyltransferase